MPIAEILELRLLPTIAIARFGSSPDPMDNYELVANDPVGFYTPQPALTLQVNVATGEITGAAAPAEFRVRDAAGRIKPVAPFFELWARFELDGDLHPLTERHLSEVGLSPSDVSWRVHVANHKAFRRTGAEDDKIDAEIGPFSTHDAQAVDGQCANFVAGADPVRFGQVQYIKPTPEFPEIRLRFTPASGLVYGPETDASGDIPDNRKVYRRDRPWLGHNDGATGTPPFTQPGGIYARGPGGSLGYLDDSCDGVIVVQVAGVEAPAVARISSGPPDFAPDCLSIRTVADELEQMLLGPEVQGNVDAEDVIDIMRRAVQTILLMNTDAMNASGMRFHDTRFGRRSERIFMPPARAAYATVRAIHLSLLNSVAGLAAPAGSMRRNVAVAVLQAVLDRLRRPDQVGDLSDAGRGRMPALMRGSDGLHLALTRRQINKIERAISQFGQSGTAQQPELNMLTLIATLSFASDLHMGISVGDGRQLAELFADPRQLLDYLRTAKAKGLQAGAELGRDLVAPGDPDQSALVRLISNPTHVMFGPFSNPIPSLNKTGVEIVREWISSL